MGHKRIKKEQNAGPPEPSIENEEVPTDQPVVKKSRKSKKKVVKTELQIEPTEVVPPVDPSPAKKIRKKREKKSKKEVNTVHEKLDDNDIEENNIEEPQDLNEDIITAEIEQHENEVKVETTMKSKRNNNLDDEKAIDWPEEDLQELVKRLESAIPEKDTLAYSTRVEKLKWDDISFKNYTAAECKAMWQLVQKRLRRFRLLHELLPEAKQWISKPWTSFYGGQKTKRHPDMPRRPLSTYMLFYVHKRDKIIEENPGLEVTEISKIITQMYKELPPAKREKYMKEAADKRRQYDTELDEFYRVHPELIRNMERHGHLRHGMRSGPKKPNTPFNLFFESQLKPPDVDRHTFKEQCKDQWKNMSDKKKVIWINWALDEEAKYQDELKNYISQNPHYVPSTTKPVLTKEEKSLKERLAGKPVKPPNSAYSLYSRIMLQSDGIKYVNPKDRMVYIADKWKNCTDEERKTYSEQIIHLREQYKLNFATYLESLPEEKRQEELRNSVPKRKRSTSKNDDSSAKKKKIDEKSSQVENNNKGKKNKEQEADKKKDDDKKDDKKMTPFAKPPYWNRMKKEEKRTFKNAMLKLKEHLDSRFEKYITNRDTESSDQDSDDSEESGSSSNDSN